MGILKGIKISDFYKILMAGLVFLGGALACLGPPDCCFARFRAWGTLPRLLRAIVHRFVEVPLWPLAGLFSQWLLLKVIDF